MRAGPLIARGLCAVTLLTARRFRQPAAEGRASTSFLEVIGTAPSAARPASDAAGLDGAVARWSTRLHDAIAKQRAEFDSFLAKLHSFRAAGGAMLRRQLNETRGDIHGLALEFMSPIVPLMQDSHASQRDTHLEWPHDALSYTKIEELGGTASDLRRTEGRAAYNAFDADLGIDALTYELEHRREFHFLELASRNWRHMAVGLQAGCLHGLVDALVLERLYAPSSDFLLQDEGRQRREGSEPAAEASADEGRWDQSQLYMLLNPREYELAHGTLLSMSDWYGVTAPAYFSLKLASVLKEAIGLGMMSVGTTLSNVTWGNFPLGSILLYSSGHAVRICSYKEMAAILAIQRWGWQSNYAVGDAVKVLINEKRHQDGRRKTYTWTVGNVVAQNPANLSITVAYRDGGAAEVRESFFLGAKRLRPETVPNSELNENLARLEHRFAQASGLWGRYRVTDPARASREEEKLRAGMPKP